MRFDHFRFTGVLDTGTGQSTARPRPMRRTYPLLYRLFVMKRGEVPLTAP
jgi:hypothetical protein